MKLDVTRAARADLLDIYQFSTRQWGKDKARDYVFGIREHFRALVAGHLSGTAAEEIGPGIRRLISGSHIIWFRIDQETLRVIRVLHGSRDAGRWIS